MELEPLLQRALDRGEEGDWEGMARGLEDALEAFPESPEVLVWLGVAERELGLGGSAYDRFKAALSLAPQDPVLLATAGNGLAQFDDPDAESALRSAALLAPKLPLARWMYGAYLSREGLFEDALRELRAAVELDPEDPTIAFELGVALALQGDLESAADFLTRSVELDPGEGWGQVILGLVEAELDRTEEAVRDLSEGARLRPEDVEAQLLAALVAGLGGWEELAWEMLERGRQGAEAGDLPLLEAVESRLDGGAGGSGGMLARDVLPGALRDRLMIRP